MTLIVVFTWYFRYRFRFLMWIVVSWDEVEIFLQSYRRWPVPVAARSKASVYGRSPTEIVGSNPTGGMEVFLL